VTARAGARGWVDIGKATFKEFNEDRIPAVAAGSTFYALLAVFPALGAFVSLYGLISDVGAVQKQIASLTWVLPGGAISVIGDQMTRLATADHGGLGLALAVSLALSILSSNAGMKGLIAGLNIAFEQKETRGFIKLNLVSLGFTVAGIAFTVMGLASVMAAPALLRALGLDVGGLLSLLRWPVMLAVVVLLLSVLYRFAPAGRVGQWRWVTPGAAVAAVGWVVMSIGFSWYVAHFGHYNATYGSLGAVIGFMTWLWLSLIVVLLGAEFDSELAERASRRE
jgi:membrane protein